MWKRINQIYGLPWWLRQKLPTVQETWVQSLGQEDPLEEAMATHSNILAWRIPWTEKPGGLHSMELQRVGYNWATNTFTFTSSLWYKSIIMSLFLAILFYFVYLSEIFRNWGLNSVVEFTQTLLRMAFFPFFSYECCSQQRSYLPTEMESCVYMNMYAHVWLKCMTVLVYKSYKIVIEFQDMII